MSDYKYVCITDVCSSIFAGGDAPKSNFSHELTEECCYPIFSNGESNSGLYGYTNTARVTEPSITVSARGTIGYTAIRLTPFTPIVRLISITPIQSVIDIDYLYYALTNYNPKNTGTSIPQLTVPMIKEYKFKLPERAEQKRAVKALKQLDSILEKEKKQIQKLDTLVKSRFVEMFGDPVNNSKNLPLVLLGDLSELITKGSSPSWQGFSYIEDNTQTLFVTSENVRKGYLDFSQPKYIENSFNKKQSRSVLKRGDFLINIVGASIGRAALFDIDVLANINQAVSLVRIKDDRIRNSYLLTYLNSDKAQQMYNSMKSDTGRANLSLKDISNLSILLPPVSAQIEYELFVSKINKQKTAVQKSIEKLEILKKSLMQEYFG